MIVEFDQAVAHSTKRGDAPKTLCAAEDRPSAVRLSAVCVVLEDGAAVLHGQHRNAALALRIFGSARAIIRLNVAKRDCPPQQRERENRAVAASLREA